MIATHNIKVNGRWIHAGEEYVPETEQAPMKDEETKEAPEVEAEKAPEEKPEQKEEIKPKTTVRRKKVSE